MLVWLVGIHKVNRFFKFAFLCLLRSPSHLPPFPSPHDFHELEVTWTVHVRAE